MAEKKTEEKIFLTTKTVNEILDKENKSLKLKNTEKLWFKNIRNVRKAYLKFAMTKKEIKEYYESKMSVHYFAQKYCQIKLEDGSIGHMKLRDYQKDIIDLYTKNRFSILLASRQVGKCVSFFTNVDVFDENKNKTEEVPIFELYYSAIKEKRKLTLTEKIKYFLYRLYIKL